MLELVKYTHRSCRVCADGARHSKSTCMTFRGVGALPASSMSGCGPVSAREVPPSNAPHRAARLRR
jgi:hypothetical protein